jgi:DNA-binding NtrC family response regulator
VILAPRDESLRLAEADARRSEVIALTDGDDAEGARELVGQLFATVPRSASAPAGLAVLVASAARSAELAERAERVEEEPDPIAASVAMRSLLRSAQVAARSAAPVLVVGEEGTGKRTLARWVHARSPRASLPFVVLPCSSLSSEAALRDALLGSSGPGDEAGEGTLALERVDALGPDAQDALASVVEGGSLRCRVLATALPSIRNPTRAAPFSRELYFRLGAFVLDVPALRARRDDIPVLAHVMARRIAERFSIPPKRFTRDALRVLRAHPLPGNIPELEAMVLRAVTTGQGDTVAPGDLGVAQRGTRAKLHDDLEPYAAARARVLSEFDHEYVERALTHAGGNVSQAARAAGLDPANMRRLVRRVRGQSKTLKRPAKSKG